MPLSVCDPSPSDEELALQAQRGCADSLDELLRRFQTPLLHFLRQRGGAAEAEDVLQETFVRAFQNLHRYRRRWRFATWMFTIARRTSINSARRKRPMADPAAIGAAACPRLGPAETATRDDSRKHFWAIAHDVLSEEEVTALWLHYVEEMPVREVARVLGRSWVAVKTMMFRARKKLVPRIGGFEPEGLSHHHPGKTRPAGEATLRASVGAHHA